jgi:hypothetical protein
MNIPIRLSPQKPTAQKRMRKDSSPSQSQSQSPLPSPLPSPGLLLPSSSDRVDWSDSGSDSGVETPPTIPPLGCIFSTHEDLLTYAKEWTLPYGYTLVLARSTKKDGRLTRVYLRCDRGGKPKAGQEKTRLIECPY